MIPPTYAVQLLLSYTLPINQTLLAKHPTMPVQSGGSDKRCKVMSANQVVCLQVGRQVHAFLLTHRMASSCHHHSRNLTSSPLCYGSQFTPDRHPPILLSSFYLVSSRAPHLVVVHPFYLSPIFIVATTIGHRPQLYRDW